MRKLIRWLLNFPNVVHEDADDGSDKLDDHTEMILVQAAASDALHLLRMVKTNPELASGVTKYVMSGDTIYRLHLSRRPNRRGDRTDDPS